MFHVLAQASGEDKPAEGAGKNVTIKSASSERHQDKGAGLKISGSSNKEVSQLVYWKLLHSYFFSTQSARCKKTIV